MLICKYFLDCRESSAFSQEYHVWRGLVRWPAFFFLCIEGMAVGTILRFCSVSLISFVRVSLVQMVQSTTAQSQQRHHFFPRHLFRPERCYRCKCKDHRFSGYLCIDIMCPDWVFLETLAWKRENELSSTTLVPPDFFFLILCSGFVDIFLTSCLIIWYCVFWHISLYL